MNLSSKTRYSLRILLQIAEETVERPSVKGKVLASKQKISEPYLEQIMIQLKSSGLVRTTRGCNGGYSLNRAPEEITVLDILELFEGKIQFADGLLNQKESIHDHCPSTRIWEELSLELERHAAGITLRSILDRMKNPDMQEYVI